MCVCVEVAVWKKPLGEEGKGRRPEERGSFEKQKAGEEMALACRWTDSCCLSCMVSSAQGRRKQKPEAPAASMTQLCPPESWARPYPRAWISLPHPPLPLAWCPQAALFLAVRV